MGCGKVSREGGAGETCGLEQNMLLGSSVSCTAADKSIMISEQCM